jgi:error-prone DNA polymerase
MFGTSGTRRDRKREGAPFVDERMFGTLGCVGFNNPDLPWKDVEALLSGRARLTTDGPEGGFDVEHEVERGVERGGSGGTGRRRDGRAPGSPSWNGGGDSPAWSRKRQPYEAPYDPDATQPLHRPGTGDVPYAELHCHSNFSFLTGASHPEQLAEEAGRLGLEALALTDRDGLYGVVRFAEAARAVGLPTVFGSEIALTPGLADGVRHARAEAATDRQVRVASDGDRHVPDPPERTLVVLADGPDGYARLARALSLGHLAGEKGSPQFALDDLADLGRGHWWVLTGGRAGTVPAALLDDGPSAARRELQRLVERFGRDRVLVELWDHGDPYDSARNDALVEIAGRLDVACVATNHVHYAVPAQRRLAAAVAAVRTRRSLDELDPWLPATTAAHLRSGAEQARRFGRYPGVVDLAAEIGRAAAFDLALVAPKLPPYPCPPGPDGRPLTEMQYLRRLAAEGARRRYGDRPAAGEDLSVRARAWRTIDHELDVIDGLGFAGYFLVVWDIVEFCRRADIYCQGRGSAANSAVCYALGITKADAVSLGLLFERFLSPERDGPPDIDLDIESDRREEVIQYVYERYGRHHTAQVANVITYRSRSSVRDMARALGFAPGQQDAWSKQMDAWGNVAATVEAGGHDIPAAVLDLAAEIEDAPRHLGIHSGGMVICDRPVIEVCPVEWARMDRRSVLQWDKDDCAAAGLVKFDLLGLGMLSALHGAVDLIREHRGYAVDLATIPQEDEVYAMLCRADTVGVFQIESRAQMATLPRLKPRRFYDLVVEVALIRPGPIQGGSVHPYIRRRNGQEPITYLHPLLENSLGKTLGVPLFQEQLMQMAIDVAGFTPSEADQLRQAMGSKRSRARMERLKQRLYEGMAERGITGAVADEIFTKMAAFANYGFPESHSVSFSYLVYASSWIKYHEPAAFCAALINAQPMGFWSPHSLVQDARRHGVVVHGPDLNASPAQATLEPCGDSVGGVAVRLGISSVRGIGTELAECIATGRPYVSMEDLVRRVGLAGMSLQMQQLEAMATAGVFGCFEVDRRTALWQAGAAAQAGAGRLEGIVTGVHAPRLPGMDPVEEAVADLWATGISANGHPTRFLRDELRRQGVLTADDLRTAEPHSKVLIAGVVTHRQRPMTAQGTTFMNLEDETGLINVVISKGCWARHRAVARDAAALVIRGRLERSEGVVNVVAEALTPLNVPAAAGSRDFR